MGLLVVLVVVGVAGAAAPTAQVGKLVPDTGPSGLYSVAVSGGTIVVGQTGPHTSSSEMRRGSGRSRRASRRSRRRRGSDFGYAVAVSGNTILVGERTLGGAAYVFVRNGSGWVQQAKLTPTDGPMAGDFTAYGASLAISGNTAVVGANAKDTTAGTDAGAAYVFERDAAGVWSQRAKLEAAGATPNDQFGFALALSRSRLAISAPDSFEATDGAVYVFEGAGSTWAQSAKIVGDDPNPFVYFGASLGFSGSTILVGVPVSQRFPSTPTSPPLVGIGHRARLHGVRAATWSRQAILQADDGFTEDLFGISAALDGDTAVVTASADDDNGQNSGSAYVFTRDSSGSWSQETKLKPLDGAAGQAFGWQLGSASRVTSRSSLHRARRPTSSPTPSRMQTATASRTRPTTAR